MSELLQFFQLFPALVDECADYQLNSCQDICTDLPAGFECSCRNEGFELDADDSASCIGSLQT